MNKPKKIIVAALALASFCVTSGVEAQQQPAQQAAPQLPQAPNMTFFVTSVGPGKGADLGGLEGADALCLQLAQRHGAGGKTWRAYLSTQAADGKPAVNARDRIIVGNTRVVVMDDKDPARAPAADDDRRQLFAWKW